MIKETTRYLFIITFVFSIGGCGDSLQIPDRTKIETKNETKPLSIPEYELIETPRYRELKKQVEQAQNEADKLESEKNLLLAKYTDEYPPVKKISNNLEKAEKKLYLLKQLLNQEAQKLEFKPKNAPV